MLKVAFRTEYEYTLPQGHRFPMEKYPLLKEQLLYEGTITEENLFQPDALTEAEVLSTHTPQYLSKLLREELSAKEIRKIGFPMTSALVKRGLHIAKGTYLCALHAMDHGVAMNIAGGTHHAYPGHGEGFCVFNDIAIASRLLLERTLVNRILIVDLDVHQGNGTAFIFHREPRVFTFSMHGHKNYPHRKEESDLDIGLADGTGGGMYNRTLRRILPLIIDSHIPDIVFYLSGVDVLENDKLGRLKLSKEDCRERDRIVFETCRQFEIPVAVAMGGGYAHNIRDIVDTHANTFRIAREIHF